MIKINKKSVYTQKREQTNIVYFAKEKADRSYRIERGTAKGKDYLRIVVPSEKNSGEEKNINCSFLFGFPLLCDPFADVLAKRFKEGGDQSGPISVGSCVTTAGQLNNGFCSYLQSKGMAGIDLASITPSLVNGFFAWLDCKRVDGKPFKLSTKDAYAAVLKSLIRGIRSIPQWAASLRGDLDFSPPWGNDTTDAARTKTIPEDEWAAIYNVCKKEITETMALVRHMRAVMEANLDHPIAMRPDSPLLPWEATKGNRYGPGHNPYSDLGLFLATLRNRASQIALDEKKMRADMMDRHFIRALRSSHGPVAHLGKCFYPTNRDLVPFVLMMGGIHLDYNPETILGSNIDDYRIRHNEFGRKILDVQIKDTSLQGDGEQGGDDGPDFKANARKGRALQKKQSQIRPATDDPDNPAAIYQFLLEWTEFIRPLAKPMFVRRLFLFMPQKHDRQPRSFNNPETDQACNDNNWKHALKIFYKDHGLPHHSLNRFRPTGMDITDAVSGGDIRITQAAANHADVETTYGPYKTSAQQDRGDEELGNITEHRRRFLKTGGRSDPRNKPEGADQAAATPGWSCVDPYSGPYTKINELCGGFGRCPGCPHSGIDVDDPYSVAQAFNLLAAIDEAATRLSQQAWRERWAPVRAKLLDYWMPKFPQSSIDQAKLMNLRPLPPLE